MIKDAAGDGKTLTAIQAILLLFVTIGTLAYSLNKRKIKTKNIESTVITVGIGLALGMISSFLGIGGGPMNLPVLYFFFSMKTKEAAQNSLFIILISQFTSIMFTVIRGTIPANLPIVLLLLMSAAGIIGGIIGRFINKKINSHVVDILFIILLSVIMCVCAYNFVRNIV